MKMNNYKKGSVALIALIVSVLLIGTLVYFSFKQDKVVTTSEQLVASTTPIITSTSSPAMTASSTPTPVVASSTTVVSLNKQFTLKKNQVVRLGDSGIELKITAFYNSPCPAGAQCLWSGLGVGLEYRLNGQVQKGVNLAQAFGYETTIVKTDYKTYANLIAKKVK